MTSVDDIEQIKILQNCEKLVSTVVRAFFDDESILLIDTIIREKYLKDKDDELGAKLGLQPKQIRGTLARLKREGLVQSEEMIDEYSGGKKANYWYVDFQYAVDVIRLRIYLMQSKLKDEETKALARQTYVCERCGMTFGVLEITKLLNAANSFCCSNCCENDTHEKCVDIKHSLKDVDNKEKLEHVTRELKALKDQLTGSSEATVPRVGILELIKELHDKDIPSNLPSELRARGVGGMTGQHGASRMARFQDDRFSLHQGYAAQTQAKRAAAAGNSNKGLELLYTRNAAGQDVVVELEVGSSEEEDEERELYRGVIPSIRTIQRKADEEAKEAREAETRHKKSLPEFLMGSKISGSGDAPSTDTTSTSAAAQPLDSVKVSSEALKAQRAKYLEQLKLQEAREIAMNGGPHQHDEDDIEWEVPEELGGVSRRAGFSDELSMAVEDFSQHTSAKWRDFTVSVGNRTMAMEDLTPSDLNVMSAAEYTEFYRQTAEM